MAKITCPKCNAQAIDDSSFFCYRCGMQLSEIPEIKNARDLNIGMKLVKKESMNARDDSLLSRNRKPGSIKRIKTIEICAYCGAPVIDKNNIFCPKCAANVRDLPTGEKSPIIQHSVSTSLEKKQVINSEIYQNTKNKVINGQESVLIQGTSIINLKTGKWKLIIGLAGLLIVFIMLMLIVMLMFTFWVSLY